MVFGHDGSPLSHDTVTALAEAAALVNTNSDDGDSLIDEAGLDEFLATVSVQREAPADRGGTGRGSGVADQIARPVDGRQSGRGGRDGQRPASQVERSSPILTKHDEWDWHLHLTGPGAPLAERIGAEAAMGFLDLVRADDLDRLRICAADDCTDVLVDLSKNRSKRYCDTGNCGNRTNVAAYRARKRSATS